MNTQKLSISIPIQQYEFIENYQTEHHYKTRSEVISEALRLLQQTQLEACYEEANKEIDDSFDATVADGIDEHERGDIYFANLDPTMGDEIRKKRPVIVISNDANNKVASTVTVVPVTSNIKKIFPFEVLLPTKQSGLSKDSKAQCHQVRTISKLRMQESKTGKIDQKLMTKIEDALMLHLDLF